MSIIKYTLIKYIIFDIFVMEVIMNITKYETNFKRKLFMQESYGITMKPDIYKEENKIINVYPSIEFQQFIGFGRCINSVLLAIIYQHVQKKSLIIF